MSKFLTITIFITSFSLLYVYQQTEVFRLAYVGQKRQMAYEDLLDKNCILRYNINRNSSLTQIGSRLAKNSDFQMPDTYRLVRISGTKSTQVAKRAQNNQTFLARIFGVRQQAEAKTINP